jgi:phage antirepressor YoqD-like protein
MSSALSHPASPSFLPALPGVAGAVPTMSSREIAELCEKRHDHVLRDVEKMLAELREDAPKFGAIYLDAYGREQREYRLPKDLTLTLVSGYNVRLRKAIIDKWQALEAAAAAPVVPQSFADALQLAADQQRALEAQRIQIAALEPKAAALDQIAEIEGSTSVTRAAKLLGIPPKELFRFLAENRWIYRVGINGPWTGYQVKIDAGYLVQKLRVVDEQHAFEQVRVTRSGLTKLGTLLNANVQLDLLASPEAGQ